MFQDESVNQVTWPCELSQNTADQLLQASTLYHSLGELTSEPDQLNRVGVTYVARGVLTVYISNADSRHLFSSLLGPFDWIGALALVDNPDTVIYAEEIEPATLRVFPWEKIRELTEVNSEVYKWLYHAAGKMQSKLMQSQFTANYGRESRVVYAILDLLAQQPSVAGAIPSLRVTQTQISLISGMTRPRVNEMLKKLEREGDIALERNVIKILNIEGLNNRLSNEELIFRDPRKLIGKLKASN